MGEVIDFPGTGDIAIRKALDYFRTTYRKAGLTEDEITAAMDELEPIVRKLLVNHAFEMTFAPGICLTEAQVQGIKGAHDECMRGAIKYFGQQMWLSLCIIAGLIGRNTESH